MRNYELIKAIYDRCPDATDHPYTIDQYFDRCQDIINLIERERPELAVNRNRQNEAGIDY